jgi:hypothetical protein
MEGQKYPVVARSDYAYPNHWGSYLRGVVFMRAGRFCAGTEELFEPDSMKAMAFTFPAGEGHQTVEEAKVEADVLANTVASIEQPEDLLPEESDITKYIQSIEESKWTTIEALEEVKTHIGLLRDPEDGDQYYAGIERSYNGGDSEIVWCHGPLGTIDCAQSAASELLMEAMEPVEEPVVRRSPGMR